MKFQISQVGYLLTERETRRNLKALIQFVVFLVLVIAVFSVLFDLIMLLEGQDHT